MRKLLALLAALTSCNTLAHSQYPMEIEKVAMRDFTHVEINVGNMRSVNQKFEIEIDGKPTGKQFTLRGGDTKKMNVKISNIVPDKIKVYEVCSVSVPLENDTYRTRICTDAKLIYPLTKLKKFHKDSSQ